MYTEWFHFQYHMIDHSVADLYALFEASSVYFLEKKLKQ